MEWSGERRISGSEDCMGEEVVRLESAHRFTFFCPHPGPIPLVTAMWHQRELYRSTR